MKKVFESQESYYPNHYPEANEFMEAIWNGFWTHKEFNWSSDLLQFHNKLKPIEQQVVIRSLLSISQIEVSVKSFWANLGTHLPQPIWADLGYTLASNEVIHAKAYSNLLVILGLEDEFKKVLAENGELKQRHMWLQRCVKTSGKVPTKEEFLTNLVRFTLFTENVSLFSQFYILSHLHRYKNYLSKVNQQIDYTLHEEKLHAATGIWIANLIYEQYPEMFEDGRIADHLSRFIEYPMKSDKRLIKWILEDYHNDNLTPEIVYAYICKRMEDAIDQLHIPLKVNLDYDRSLLEKTSFMNDDSEGLAIVDFFHKRPTGYTKNIDWSDLDF